MTILAENDFAQHLLDTVPISENFEPFAFNNKEGDCYEFFVSPADYYSERVDDFLTLYLDMESNDIVGFVIKRISHILKKLSKTAALAFIVKDDVISLDCLFAAMLADCDDSIKMEVREYKRVVEIAENNRVSEIEYANA